jgi:hypothetical protein
MKPVKRTITGAASLVIPLNHYGEVGCSWFADQVVVVDALADRSDPTSVIAAGISGGNFMYPADAILVTTTVTTNVVINQYGN